MQSDPNEVQNPNWEVGDDEALRFVLFNASYFCTQQDNATVLGNPRTLSR